MLNMKVTSISCNLKNCSGTNMESNKVHIKYPLTINEFSGTVVQEGDYTQYIGQLVRQVLLTNPGERINRPDFGCGIKQMVFMPLNEATGSVTQVMIYQALEKWLGSVIEVDQVQVAVENTSLLIDIAYTVRSLGQRQYLNMEVPV